MKCKLFKLITTTIAFVALATCLTSCGGKTLNAQDYAQIQYSGLNGQGSARVEVDYDALILDALGEEPTDMDKEFQYFQNSLLLSSAVEFELETENSLTNGDSVKISTKINESALEQLDIKMNASSWSEKVSGLAEGKELDAYAPGVISVAFSGFSGTGNAELTVHTTEDIYKYLRYELNKTHELSNGDKLIVTVTFNESTLAEQGYYAPKVTETTYIVEGLTEYVTQAADIPSDIVTFLSQELMANMEKSVEEDREVEYLMTKAPSLLNAYFATTNDPTVTCRDLWHGLDMQNAIIVMGHYVTERTSIFSNYTNERWPVIVAQNAYWDTDGKIAYGDVVTFNADINSAEDFISWFTQEYSEMDLTVLPW